MRETVSSPSDALSNPWARSSRISAMDPDEAPTAPTAGVEAARSRLAANPESW
ncbi:hypothetical protein ABZ726_25705 [Streptomyces hundungensis]|uniref:hypothetical protein n=1 Tax=Streptomyces hundungensis TaxID=1077946 RepID=UPI0033E730A0